MEIGFADDLFRSSNEDTRQKWLKKSRKAGASIARLEVFWRAIAPTQPLSPTNPNDLAYKWGTLDAAVADANAEGPRSAPDRLARPELGRGARAAGERSARHLEAG